MRKDTRQVRSVDTMFLTREDGEELIIEGYFAVFNSIYKIAPGMTESIAPGAFDKTISGDIRALTNHDTRLVLGRTKAHTLMLKLDECGLWGSIIINKNDIDALNLYARVKRGDVNQCSFGFDIIDEETEIREDGSVHWTIREVELYEVTVCTFPAYEDTNISARMAEKEQAQKRACEAWKISMKKRLKGGEKTC